MNQHVFLMHFEQEKSQQNFRTSVFVPIRVISKFEIVSMFEKKFVRKNTFGRAKIEGRVFSRIAEVHVVGTNSWAPTGR